MLGGRGRDAFFIIGLLYEIELGNDLRGHDSDTVSLAAEGEMSALLYVLDL